MENVVKYEKLTYSVAEAAKCLGVAESTMYTIIKMDGFPLLKLGGRRLIPIKGFERWIEDQAAKGWRQ